MSFIADGSMKNDHEKLTDLRPARPKVAYAGVVTMLTIADLAGRCAWLAFLIQRHRTPSCIDKYGASCDLLGRLPLSLTLLEMAISLLLLNKFGRWEDQGHLITFWQVTASAMIMAVRRSLYAEPMLFLFAILLLLSTYFVGIMAEFREDTEIRLPPFCPKKEDINKRNYGWLGPNAAMWLTWKPLRVLICFVLWASTFTRTFLFFYFGAISVEDDLRGLGDNLDALFWAAIIGATISLLPNFTVEICTWPDFFKDLMKTKRSSNVYRTGAYDMCSLDDDLRKDSELSQKLKSHKCHSLTVVLPAYMPNEEEILMPVLDYYREREQEYPGEYRVMLVWNSPQEHPEMEVQLNQLMQQWPSFTALRCLSSTSKCDNLNMAMENLTTDMALLNDADTMVSAATMCRASINMFEDGLDIVQSNNIHCWDDFIGRPEDGCFLMGAFTTLTDGTKPINMSTQGLYKHSPFNGRGGFWRTTSLKKVGFDYRIIGEDHDAAYRGFAYFGLKGVLDPNMLCMEREPPNCSSLTNQRTRWETAALQMRRTFPWALRSKHYTPFEAFLLIWSQVCWNANMPLQQMPLQVCQMIPLAVVKGFLHRHVFGNDDASFRNMCKHEDCVAKMVINGEEIAFPMAFVVFASLFVVMIILYVVDVVVRTAVTRYRPRAAFFIFNVFLAPFIMTPFRTYVQFWALYDYCWGDAKFICTSRSSTGSISNTMSMKQSGDATGTLTKPLLSKVQSWSSDAPTALPFVSSTNSIAMMTESSRSASTNSVCSMNDEHLLLA